MANIVGTSTARIEREKEIKTDKEIRKEIAEMEAIVQAAEQIFEAADFKSFWEMVDEATKRNAKEFADKIRKMYG